MKFKNFQDAADQLTLKLKADLDDLVGLGKSYISPTGLFSAKGLYIKIDSDGLIWSKNGT
jgi:hypothetical protein